MKSKSLLRALAACTAAFWTITPLRAEEGTPPGGGGDATVRVVVSANKIETPAELVGSAVTVIEEETIERRGHALVADTLRGEPGVDVVQSGPPGGNASIFLRGLNAEHTLVLIDGIEANSPVSNARFFNFADLSLENIERIEILRGPQSTLYGSDAMGGVINIITKRGSGAPRLTVSAEAGSYDTFIERLSLLGSEGIVDYSLGATRQDIHGVSAAATAAGNSEDDPYENTGISGRIGVTPSEFVSLAGVLRYNDSRSDIDNAAGPLGDDPNRVLENEQLFTAFEARTDFLGGRLEQLFRVGYSDQEFTDDNDFDELNPADFLRSRFEGELLKFEFQNSAQLAEQATLVVGIETEEERANSTLRSESEFGPFSGDFGPIDARTNGYYVQLLGTAGERFAASAGVRVDDHSEFGSEVTYRVAPAFFVHETGTKLAASVGTGFKAPSLFQLFSSFGNPELDAEESLGADGGIEQRLFGDRLAVEARYFWNDLENLITFDPQTFIFENIGDARTRGVETAVTVLLPWDARLGATYTYTDTEDSSTGESLLRRARNKAALELVTVPFEDTELAVRAVYTGPRFDTDFSGPEPARVRLGGYTLVNLTAKHRLSDTLELFARVENLFDKDFEEVLGFGEFGVAAYGGIRVNLG